MGATRRCTFRDGSRRCVRNGYGDPPLCRAHAVYAIVEGEEIDGSESPLPDILDFADRIMSRSQDELVKGVRDFLGDMLADTANPPRSRPRQRARPRPEPPPPREPPPPPPPPPPIDEDPRDVLGFAPTLNLTKELVKKRQRELARLYHPDQGGSLKAMQRVNDAAEKLLAML